MSSTASPLPKHTNAERVRNNQRRSRARRKAYISELEEKIRQYESGHATNSAAAEFEEASKKFNSLKALLSSLGLDEEFLEAFTKAQRLAATLSSDQERTAPVISMHGSSLRRSKTLSVPETDTEVYMASQEAAHLLLLPSVDLDVQRFSIRPDLANSDTEDVSLPWTAHGIPSDLSCLLNSENDPSISGSLGDYAAIDLQTSPTTPTEQSPNSTTLCTVAFSLVLERNRKGCSPEELDLKLRVGYQFSATALEGCRVDNHVLLEVLAEIA